MEKQKCPELRFNGFFEVWNTKRLSDLGSIQTGSTPSTSDESYYSKKGLMWVTPTDINGQLVLNTDKKLSILGRKKARIVPPNTILVTCIASIGKNALLLEEGSFNQQINSLTPFERNDPYFLLTQSYFWSIGMQQFAAKGTMQIVNKTQFSNIETFVPSMLEQSSIGNFFQNFDQSIALHEKKLSQTQNLKKAMLEKMFPTQGSNRPEIRLKGFSGDWEEIELEDIFGKIRNAFVGTATPYYVKSGNFYLESNNVKDGKINRKTQIFINDYFYFKQQDKWLKTNDIVMVQSGHVGHTAVIPEELNNSAAHALIMFTDYKIASDSYFINYQFQTNKSKVAVDKITTGNTIKHILSSDMKKFILLFPCANEQKKIGEFFKKVDETLNLQQQQLQTLKNLKQAFLEKMFV